MSLKYVLTRNSFLKVAFKREVWRCSLVNAWFLWCKGSKGYGWEWKKCFIWKIVEKKEAGSDSKGRMKGGSLQAPICQSLCSSGKGGEREKKI